MCILEEIEEARKKEVERLKKLGYLGEILLKVHNSDKVGFGILNYKDTSELLKI